MTIYLHTNGCAVLRHETERMAKFFTLNGCAIADHPEEADVVVMTCCGVTHNEEGQALDIIARLDARRRPGSRLIVGGCLPSFAREQILAAAPQAQLMTYDQMADLERLLPSPPAARWEDTYYNHGHLMRCEDHRDDTIAAPPRDLDLQLAKSIDALCGSSSCRRAYDLSTLRRYIWQDEEVYQIKVAYGCPGHCSYCATKLAIGDFRSVPLPTVMKQLREGIAAGYRRFTLMGDEIGSYGADFGSNIVALLDAFHAEAPAITVSIRYIHPDIFVRHYAGLKPYLIGGYVDFFCCAIQSGSPKMLRAMNRNPAIEPFIRCMEDLNAAGCRANKHTQILVGFPGETDGDIWQTLDALLRCDFDHININKYSRRRGTAAYAIDETVGEAVKVARCSLIRRVMMMGKKAKLYDAIRSSFFPDGQSLPKP